MFLEICSIIWLYNNQKYQIKMFKKLCDKRTCSSKTVVFSRKLN